MFSKPEEVIMACLAALWVVLTYVAVRFTGHWGTVLAVTGFTALWATVVFLLWQAGKIEKLYPPSIRGFGGVLVVGAGLVCPAWCDCASRRCISDAKTMVCLMVAQTYPVSHSCRVRLCENVAQQPKAPFLNNHIINIDRTRRLAAAPTLLGSGTKASAFHRNGVAWAMPTISGSLSAHDKNGAATARRHTLCTTNLIFIKFKILATSRRRSM